VRRTLYFQADRIEMVLGQPQGPGSRQRRDDQPSPGSLSPVHPTGCQDPPGSQPLRGDRPQPGCVFVSGLPPGWSGRSRSPRTEGKVVPLLPLCQRLAQEDPQSQTAVPPLTAVLGLDPEGVPSCCGCPAPMWPMCSSPGLPARARPPWHGRSCPRWCCSPPAQPAGGTGRPQGAGLAPLWRGCLTWWCRW